MWQAYSVIQPTAGFSPGYWYVYNAQTGKKKKIGKFKMKGVNYHDRAVEEAKERNFRDYGECVHLVGTSLYDDDGNYVREYAPE